MLQLYYITEVTYFLFIFLFFFILTEATWIQFYYYTPLCSVRLYLFKRPLLLRAAAAAAVLLLLLACSAVVNTESTGHFSALRDLLTKGKNYREKNTARKKQKKT